MILGADCYAGDAYRLNENFVRSKVLPAGHESYEYYQAVQRSWCTNFLTQINLNGLHGICFFIASLAADSSSYTVRVPGAMTIYISSGKMTL